jgi:uncharacterized protein YbjT (DUF2867 family)
MKILVFGATGNAGKAVLAELKKRGLAATAVVRNPQKATELSELAEQVFVADVMKPSSLSGLCSGFDIVISTLGKSVSPNDKSKPTFQQVDFEANSNILTEALNSGAKKFVYLSAFHSERYPELTYFRVHHDFSEKLKASGLDYSIVQPTAIFCAFGDMIAMAKKGNLITIGHGNHKTNPIFEGDLARVIVDAISQPNAVLGAGGKHIYTRKELNEIIQRQVNPTKSIKTVPAGLFRFVLFFMRPFDKNGYDKFAFFSQVAQHDTIAPQLGDMKFEDYIAMKAAIN